MVDRLVRFLCWSRYFCQAANLAFISGVGWKPPPPGPPGAWASTRGPPTAHAPIANTVISPKRSNFIRCICVFSSMPAFPAATCGLRRASFARPPGRDKGLFVTQSLDRVQLGGFLCRVEPEEDTDQRREAERDD